MRVCPKCRAEYPARGRSTCEADGTRLIDAEEYARSQSDPLLGHRVGGRYRVIERIGTGGMGTVYRAQQSGLDRDVALKVLKSELIENRDTVARFHREAKAMSLLMHPNTVRVFDFGEDEEGHLFLAMELLEGELLTAWIEREGAPPIDQAIGVVQEILRSLAEAHEKGLIHRDLKPDNIFLARVEGHARPVVKVLDFGIAKVFRDDRKLDELETQAGTVFGTPRYMSPEQAQGKTLEHKSDLYSVGVLLYQLLTGRAPFIDDDAVVVMAKHIREDPDPPREAAPDRPIPRSLEKVVLRALEKYPEDRFESADELESNLLRCLPDVHLEVSGGPKKRRDLRLPLAIGGAVLLLSLVAAGVLVIGSAPEETTVNVAHLPLEPAIGVAPASAPERTAVTLLSDPLGAEIFDGERRVGTTPRLFELGPDEALSLRLRAPGFVPADIELSAQAAPTMAVALDPQESTTETQAESPRRQRRRRDATGSTHTPSGSSDPYERFD